MTYGTLLSKTGDINDQIRAESLCKAADLIAKHPVALQLRTLQTMAEISTEKNSTIIFPAQFMTTVQEAIKTLAKDSSRK